MSPLFKVFTKILFGLLMSSLIFAISILGYAIFSYIGFQKFLTTIPAIIFFYLLGHWILED